MLIIITASMAAWRLTRTYERKISKIIYYMLVAGMLVPFQGIMLPFVKWIDRLGLMNKPGMWFIYMGFGASMAMFLIGSFVSGIPKEIEEAASIDGCGKIRMFFFIIFPMAKPGLSTLAIYNGVNMWNEFIFAYTLTQSQGNRTLPLAVWEFQGQYSMNTPMIMSVLTLTVLPMIILFIFAQDKLIKGMAAGAVKG